MASRWATMMVVRPWRSRAIASCTAASFAASSALVASSSSSTRGLRASARASAMRWRWPPDSRWPPGPTLVSNPSGSASMKSAAAAAVAASRTSASDAPGRPIRMFAATEVSNSIVSWPT